MEELEKQLEEMKKMGMDITGDPEIIELFATLQGFKDVETSMANDYKLDIKFINKSENEDPEYATEGASGFDLRANIEESITLGTLERKLIPTGLHFEIPRGYELQVRARSGNSLKHGISLVNGIGTVDSDYRGDVGIILVNLSNEPFTINHGDRIAQGVITSVAQKGFINLNKVDTLDETERGSGGFGSTGTK